MDGTRSERATWWAEGTGDVVSRQAFLRYIVRMRTGFVTIRKYQWRSSVQTAIKFSTSENSEFIIV